MTGNHGPSDSSRQVSDTNSRYLIMRCFVLVWLPATRAPRDHSVTRGMSSVRCRCFDAGCVTLPVSLCDFHRSLCESIIGDPDFTQRARRIHHRTSLSSPDFGYFKAQGVGIRKMLPSFPPQYVHCFVPRRRAVRHFTCGPIIHRCAPYVKATTTPTPYRGC